MHGAAHHPRVLKARGVGQLHGHALARRQRLGQAVYAVHHLGKVEWFVRKVQALGFYLRHIQHVAYHGVQLVGGAADLL